MGLGAWSRSWALNSLILNICFSSTIESVLRTESTQRLVLRTNVTEEIYSVSVSRASANTPFAHVAKCARIRDD